MVTILHAVTAKLGELQGMLIGKACWNAIPIPVLQTAKIKRVQHWKKISSWGITLGVTQTQTPLPLL